MSFGRISILGLGLIGSSAARAARLAFPKARIAGFDTDAAALALGRQDHFIDTAHTSAADAVKDAELVVLATPLGGFTDLTRIIADALAEGAVLTDTGSVKEAAIAAIVPWLPAHAAYVPGHPIAGSEKTGAEAGRGDLFSGKRVILTPQESDLTTTAVASVKRFWEALGASVDFMPPGTHDLLYAYVSHLPQLVAFGYKAIPGLESVQAPFTRLLRSDATLWSGIALANTRHIETALDDFLVFAGQMQGELDEAPEAENEANSAPDVMLVARLAATCLIATASLLHDTLGVHPARYAGAGFTDMTTPATEDPEAVLSAISLYPRWTAQHLRKLTARLETIRQTLHARDAGLLQKMLADS